MEPWPLKAEGQISVEDYAEAIRMHYRGSGSSRLLIPAVLFFFFLALVAQPLIRGASLFTPISAAVVIALTIVYLRIAPERAAKSALRDNPVAKAPISIEISPEGFSASTQFGTSNLPWSLFVRRKQSDNLLLLYQNESLFHMVARRWFASDALWHDTLRLVGEQVSASPPKTMRERLVFVLMWIVILAGIAAAFLQGARTL